MSSTTANPGERILHKRFYGVVPKLRMPPFLCLGYCRVRRDSKAAVAVPAAAAKANAVAVLAAAASAASAAAVPAADSAITNAVAAGDAIAAAAL